MGHHPRIRFSFCITATLTGPSWQFRLTTKSSTIQIGATLPLLMPHGMTLADLLKLVFTGRHRTPPKIALATHTMTRTAADSSSICFLVMTAQIGTPHSVCCMMTDIPMLKVSTLSTRTACLIVTMTSQRWAVCLMTDQDFPLSKWIPQWHAMVWTWEDQSSWFEVLTSVYRFSTCGLVDSPHPQVIQQFKKWC